MTMNKKQLEYALGGMCENFGLPIIRLKLGRTPGRAWYYGPYKERKPFITVSLFPGRKEKRTCIHDLIHEFAHYLTHSRLGLLPGKTGNHGPEFRQALTDVCRYWYGNPLLYPWKTEYKRLAKLGPVNFNH